MSAISAGKRGKSVLVLERNQKPGLKILISGGGRCNFTNLQVSPETYVSQNPHFCKSALKQFTQKDFIEFVKAHNIDFYEKTLGQLFCKHSSKEILSMLLNELEAHNIELRTSITVHDVHLQETSSRNFCPTKISGISEETRDPGSKAGMTATNFLISSSQGDFIANSLIIATGGLSFPKLGATDFGYKIAKQFGHSITQLDPALDGFVFQKKEQTFFAELAGIAVPVALKINKYEFNENILFTHVGLSGPSSLKASLYWNTGDNITVDFFPDFENFQKWLEQKRSESPRKRLPSILSTLLPPRLAEALSKVSQLENKNIADLNKNELEQIEKNLKQFSFIPKSTVGFERAEVTRGGVDTNDISSQSMESKLIPGLYFVGEVVDVTGLLGGYNFQWAWSSGWVAGQNS